MQLTEVAVCALVNFVVQLSETDLTLGADFSTAGDDVFSHFADGRAAPGVGLRPRKRFECGAMRVVGSILERPALRLCPHPVRNRYQDADVVIASERNNNRPIAGTPPTVTLDKLKSLRNGAWRCIAIMERAHSA